LLENDFLNIYYFIKSKNAICEPQESSVIQILI
jgi:hypothetical protein